MAVQPDRRRANGRRVLPAHWASASEWIARPRSGSAGRYAPCSLENHGEQCSPLQFSPAAFRRGLFPCSLTPRATAFGKRGLRAASPADRSPSVRLRRTLCSPLPKYRGEQCSPLRFSPLRFVAGYFPAPCSPLPAPRSLLPSSRSPLPDPQHPPYQ